MMQNKVTYEYAVIRLVPKVEREEFINVGVIVFSKKKKYLKMKYLLDADRISALTKEVDLEMINKYLTAWQKICEGGSNGGKIGNLDIALRFRWLVASKSTIIQCSKTHPGLCIDPEPIIDELYKLYVE